MALPAPTALGATDKYTVFGNRRYTWVPTIANKAAPTSVELSAGTDLTGQVSAVSGFTVTRASIDIPNALDEFTAKLPGRSSSDSSSLTLYASSTSDDARSLLTLDLDGFVVIYPEGINTDGTCDVFPARVSSVSKPNDIEAAGMLEVGFEITSKPEVDIAIPSA